MRSTATFAQALQSVPETQVSVLDNGLRVASEQSSQPTCTVSGGPSREAASISRLAFFPRSGCDLGLESSVVWIGLLLTHRWIDSTYLNPDPS